MTTALPRLPLTISEASFQQIVIEYAQLRHWRVAHFRPARTDKGWRTPIQGHPGWPDLALAREGAFHLWELKRHGQQQCGLSPDQRAWLAALGDTARVVTPADWPWIVDVLT